MKIRERQRMVFSFKVVLGILIVGLIVPQILRADEGTEIKVTDSVNAFVYLPQTQEVKPLFVGDTIPPDGVLYLPSATSQLTFSQPGQANPVSLKTPGFYNTTGLKADLPPGIQESIAQQAQPFQAQNAIAAAEALSEAVAPDVTTAAAVDQPVTASPST